MVDSAAITRIRQIIQELTINIEIQNILIKQKSQQKFYDNPITHLVYECDIKSKKKLLEIKRSKSPEKIEYRESYTLHYKGQVIDKIY